MQSLHEPPTQRMHVTPLPPLTPSLSSDGGEGEIKEAARVRARVRSSRGRTGTRRPRYLSRPPHFYTPGTTAGDGGESAS
jgi:hypothetical protein